MTVSLREACPAFYSMKLSTGRCWRLKHGTTCTRGRPCSPTEHCCLMWVSGQMRKILPFPFYRPHKQTQVESELGQRLPLGRGGQTCHLDSDVQRQPPVPSWCPNSLPVVDNFVSPTSNARDIWLLDLTPKVLFAPTRHIGALLHVLVPYCVQSGGVTKCYEIAHKRGVSGGFDSRFPNLVASERHSRQLRKDDFI